MSPDKSFSDRCDKLQTCTEVSSTLPTQPTHQTPVTVQLCVPLNMEKMIISLSMNITMNQLGGASVIAKFHS